MEIGGRLPLVSQGQTAHVLRGLTLVPGQTLEAQVLGKAPDGATLVQIGRQALSLSLPNTPSSGAFLTLIVQQGADGQLGLALAANRSQQGAAFQSPATQVDVSGRPGAPQGLANYAPLAAGAGPVIAGVQAPTAAAVAGLGTPATTSPAGAMGKTNPAAIPPVGPNVAAGALAGATTQNPVPASPYGMSAGGFSPSSPKAGSAAQPAPNTPQGAAINQMLHQAVPRQASIGGVTAMLVSALGRSGLPEPVLQAARQVFDNQLVARKGKVDPTTLKNALRSSGLFQEASLASGAVASAKGDTKTGMLALHQNLAQWLGNQAPVAQANQVPPPLRHVFPRAKLPEIVPEADLGDEAFGRVLLERSEGALSRLRLQQHASLPDAQRPGESEWNIDLPLLIGAEQSVLHLQIHHDGSQDQARPEDRGWQVRFAINLADLGEVGAQISLRAQTVGVMLWADRSEVATLLSAALHELREDLAAAGLSLGALVVRDGAPSDPSAPVQAGQFLDASR